MKKRTTQIVLLLGALSSGSLMATPQICPIVPPENWMDKQQVAELALGLGYDKVYFVQPDGGCWVAYSEKDGVRYEVFFHPASGEVIRIETGS